MEEISETILDTINKIHVFIADDHPAITASLLEQIKTTNDMHFVGSIERLDDLIGRLDVIKKVDVLILDLLMIDGPHGTDKIAELSQKYPRTKVIIYSQYNYKHLIDKTTKLGAKGYIDKSFVPSVVIDSIRKVHQGGTVIRTSGSAPPTPPGDWIEKPNIKLTDRQKEILCCTIKGLTAAKIAAKLYLSEVTVNYHWSKLRELFGASTTLELVAKVIPIKEQLGLNNC